MDIALEPREGDEAYPWALMFGQTRLTNLRPEEAAAFRRLIEFWNRFPGEKLGEIIESLEYVRDVGPYDLDRIADGDVYNPEWRTEGDDFAGMCHHLRNLYRLFEIKDGIERWEDYGKKAQAVKTTKERAWEPST